MFINWGLGVAVCVYVCVSVCVFMNWGFGVAGRAPPSILNVCVLCVQYACVCVRVCASARCVCVSAAASGVADAAAATAAALPSWRHELSVDTRRRGGAESQGARTKGGPSPVHSMFSERERQRYINT